MKECEIDSMDTQDFYYENIVDLHSHIYPDKIAEKAVKAIGNFYDLPMEGKGTMNDMLLSGKKAGIKYFLVSSAATTPNQVTAINNFIVSLSAPDYQLFRFGTIHPGFENPTTEIKRIKSLGIQGIKLHPDFQEFNIDDPSMYPIYELLEGDLPVLFHIGDPHKDYSNPARLARVLDMFPGLTAIAAHLGGYQQWDEAGNVLIGRNIYIDTSSSLMFLRPEQAVRIIREHGTDKVLFGSDYPMWSHGLELQRFLSLGLSCEENKKILSANALDLLYCKKTI